MKSGVDEIPTPLPTGEGVLIIGYGNTLRADDGVGVVVADLIRTQLPSSRARIITAHQLGPEMADLMATASRVVFIDASAELPPGEVRFQRIEASEWMQGPLGHHLRPATLLAMTESLYGQSPEVHVLSVGVESLAYGERLSPTVDRAVERMTATLLSWLQRRTSPHPCSATANLRPLPRGEGEACHA